MEYFHKLINYKKLKLNIGHGVQTSISNYVNQTIII